MKQTVERRKARGPNKAGLQTRRRILDAAFDVATERGYDGTTLTLITEKAGLRPGSVYWQFKSKDEILAAVIDQSYEDWLEMTRRVAERFAHEHPKSVESLKSDRLPERVHAGVERAFFQLREGLISQPAFWRLGIMLSLESRDTEVTARARYREARLRNEETTTQRWLNIIHPVNDHDPALDKDRRSARTIARTWRILSDGMLIYVHTASRQELEELLAPMQAGFEATVLKVLNEED